MCQAFIEFFEFLFSGTTRKAHERVVKYKRELCSLYYPKSRETGTNNPLLYKPISWTFLKNIRTIPYSDVCCVIVL